MEKEQLAKYAKIYAEALSQNMPPDTAYVLLLIPKPDESKGMRDAALITNFARESIAIGAMAEIIQAKAAERLLAMGMSPKALDELAKKAIEGIEKTL